jgi:ribonuclease T1
LRFWHRFGTIARFRFQGIPVLQTGQPENFGLLRKLGLTILTAVALASSGSVWSRPLPEGGGDVELSSLPAEAHETDRLIRSGGPFPYRKDGIVFGNRERLLPLQQRGYYREYTVKTPGAGDRGARRMVCGGSPPRSPETCYYTDDHYASFRRIVAGR